jgi:hypothetical protein
MTTPENTAPKKKLKKWQIAIIVIFALLVIGSVAGGNTSTDSPGQISPSTNTTTTTPDSSTSSNETAGQANAVRTAKNYLDYAGFSRSGLIKQLQFEGYSASDAAYGVDAQNANWNEQAVRTAKNYLDYSGFSRSGLIKQLQFEGYSASEAAYGASANGF